MAKDSSSPTATCGSYTTLLKDRAAAVEKITSRTSSAELRIKSLEAAIQTLEERVEKAVIMTDSMLTDSQSSDFLKKVRPLMKGSLQRKKTSTCSTVEQPTATNVPDPEMKLLSNASEEDSDEREESNHNLEEPSTEQENLVEASEDSQGT